jgi:CheY-like chemotaxis protein
VLLVDDNSVNQTVSARLLEHLGCRVHVAANGFEALRLVADPSTPTFVLVFMDIQMPELDGTETTARLRQLLAAAGRPCPPVVAMTAYSMPGDEARFREVGFNDYVAKPITSRDLFGALRRQCPELQVIPAAPTDPTDPSDALTYAVESADQEAVAPSDSSLSPAQQIDPNVLEQLLAIGGASFVRQLFDDLVSDSIPQLEEAAKALAEDRIADVVAPIHQIKGASAQLGLHSMAELARTIEQAARLSESPSDVIQADFMRLRALFSTFAAEYRSALPPVN